MFEGNLVCFLGRNGSGKTYQANLLVKHQGYTKISMADAMRELLWKIFNFKPENDQEYQIFKTSLFIAKNTSLDVQISGRELLQNVGQACKEMFGQDFWLKFWFQKCLDLNKLNSQQTNITVDDIRFSIEIEQAKQLGAKFIWCDYQNGNYNLDLHPSEALANKILDSGKYKHLQEISYQDLDFFCQQAKV